MSSNKDLVDKVDRNVKYLSWARLVGITATIVAVTLILVGIFSMLYQNFKLTNQIEDCINPKGSCYQNGDRRQGAAIKTINESQKQIITIAAYCAKQPGNNTLEQIEACVNKELNR